MAVFLAGTMTGEFTGIERSEALEAKCAAKYTKKDNPPKTPTGPLGDSRPFGFHVPRRRTDLHLDAASKEAEVRAPAAHQS